MSIELAGTLTTIGGPRPAIVLELEHGPVILPCDEADCRAVAAFLGKPVTVTVTPSHNGVPVVSDGAAELRRLREIHAAYKRRDKGGAVRLEVAMGRDQWNVIATSGVGDSAVEVQLAEAAIAALCNFLSDVKAHADAEREAETERGFICLQTVENPGEPPVITGASITCDDPARFTVVDGRRTRVLWTVRAKTREDAHDLALEQLRVLWPWLEAFIERDDEDEDDEGPTTPSP